MATPAANVPNPKKEEKPATPATPAAAAGDAPAIRRAPNPRDLVGNVDDGTLYLGIDLGTSRTSICSSNGVRATVWSYVGYPRDVVSKKLLQKDVLFGKEALDNRLSVDLYRPLEKGVIKFSDGASGVSEDDARRNAQAAKDLLKYAISLARPRPDQLVYGVIGCPAQASIRNKRSLVEAAREVLDSVVICSEPFAVAYGIDLLTDALVIDIGAGTTDLCRMKGAMPDETDQVTLPFAGDHVDQVLFDLLKKKCPGAAFTVNMVKDLKERSSFVTAAAPQPVQVTFPVNGKPTRFDVTNEVREACRSIVPPMVESLEQLVATFDPEFQPRIRSNILLGGGGSQIFGLARAVEEAMEPFGGGHCSVVDEPTYAGAAGALKIAYDMPEETWEQLK